VSEDSVSEEPLSEEPLSEEPGGDGIARRKGGGEGDHGVDTPAQQIAFSKTMN
jgi:hypothetical protein